MKKLFFLLIANTVLMNSMALGVVQGLACYQTNGSDPLDVFIEITYAGKPPSIALPNPPINSFYEKISDSGTLLAGVAQNYGEGWPLGTVLAIGAENKVAVLTVSSKNASTYYGTYSTTTVNPPLITRVTCTRF